MINLSVSKIVIAVCICLVRAEGFYSMENIDSFTYDCFDSIRYNKHPKEVFLLSNPDDGDQG